MAEGLGVTESCLPQVGCFGNGTVLRSTTDVELVVFLSCFHSFQEEAKHHQAVLRTIQKRMYHCQDLLDLGLHYVGVTDGVPSGLIFTITTRETWEPITVTIVPAYRALGKGNRRLTCPAYPPQETGTPCLWWPRAFLHATHILGWGRAATSVLKTNTLRPGKQKLITEARSEHMTHGGKEWGALGKDQLMFREGLTVGRILGKLGHPSRGRTQIRN